MTKINLNKPAIPHQPTVDENHDPTACMACGRMAIGSGRGVFTNKKMVDPGYLCKGCIVAIPDLSRLDRLSPYELQALDAGVEAVGEWILQRGAGTDLAHFDELDQRMLVKAAWLGCAQGVREALKEAPF